MYHQVDVILLDDLPAPALSESLVEKVRKAVGVEGKGLLPFLLAARAVSTAPESRPVFAEGLASSYEAFLHTRKRSEQVAGLTDTDDDEIDNLICTNSGAWYLDNLESMLREYDAVESGAHPKVSATVMRVADLWS